MLARGWLNQIRRFLSGAAVEENRGEIRRRNLHSLRVFSVLGLGLAILALVCSLPMKGMVPFHRQFLLLLAYLLAMTCSAFRMRRMQLVTPSLYLWLSPLMLWAILMGTFWDPAVPAVTFMVLLCILPIIILDKPWRVLLFITVNSAVFCLCCFYAKSRHLFMQDTVDLVLFYILSIGVNSLTLEIQLRNVRYASALRLVSETDALTAIANRGAGEQRIRGLLEQKRYGMFCILDVDDFKQVNDRFGHVNGDRVLQAVADQLRQSFRAGDVVMRLGGDEFAVYALGVTDEDEGRVCAERLLRAVEALRLPDLPDCRVALSLGAAFYTSGCGKDFEALYHDGDAALYRAKREGKDRCCFL